MRFDRPGLSRKNKTEMGQVVKYQSCSIHYHMGKCRHHI